MFENTWIIHLSIMNFLEKWSHITYSEHYAWIKKHVTILWMFRKTHVNMNLIFYYNRDFSECTVWRGKKYKKSKLNFLWYLLLKTSVDLYISGQVVQFLSKLDVTIFLDGSKSTQLPESIKTKKCNCPKNVDSNSWYENF